MTEPTCATCRFFRPLPGRDGKPETTGPCYRYPPKSDDINISGEDFCGEYKPRPDVAAPELPEPWRWLDLPGYMVAAGESGTSHLAWIGVRLNGQVESNHAPIDVVRVVCDAHRLHARVGGAS